MKIIGESRAARRTVPAASALVVAVAAAAGLAAAGGYAAPPAPPGPPPHAEKFKAPKIKHGVLTIEGTNGDDRIALRLEAGAPGNLQVDVGDDGSADFTFARSDISAIDLDASRGDDTVRIDEGNGLFTDTIPTTLAGGAGDDKLTGGAGAVTLDGGKGDDTLIGGSGAETLDGGDGNDFADGNRGNDVAFMGAGDDTFQWDPGDASDVVEGQDGHDTMLFNGANVAEKVDLSANGGRLRFTRDIAAITMDTDGVEQVDFHALGGADKVTVNDLTGTDVTDVNVDLAATGGGGDGSTDTVVANGTAGADTVNVDGTPLGVSATGLAATVAVLHPDGADQLTVDGLAGNDSMNVNGTAGADSLQLLGDATGVVAAGLPALVAIANTEAGDQVAIDGLGGDDVISGPGQQAQPARLIVDGGTGDDTLGGTQGVDTILGGDGDDFVDGNRGNDVAFMGAGDDTFQWDPGDGSDAVEGQDGHDTMLFNGASIAEKMELAANGGRLRFTRDIAAITMDTDGVEQVDIVARGGADRVTVGDLTGTDVTSVNADLGAADGSADEVVANGTAGADAVTVGPDGTGVTATGLVPVIHVLNAEAANDRLTVDGLAGADRFTLNGTAGADSLGLAGDATGIVATGLPAIVAFANTESADQVAVDTLGGDDAVSGGAQQAQPARLTIDGGDGDDTLDGTQGVDSILGGGGGDFVDGNRGNDVAFMGAGDDTFQWDPGDGSDVVEGQDGQDTMLFNGANIAEKVDLSANGGRLRFTRDIASITMDTDGVERVDFVARGGADKVTVNDLTGTDVSSVNLDLGAADGSVDQVIAEGTSASDVVHVSGNASGVSVSGLPAAIRISNAEPTDQLRVDGQAGADVVEAVALTADAISLTIDGGEGDDLLLGGAGDDVILGGPGDDILLGGPGLDALDGGPGANVVIQD